MPSKSTDVKLQNIPLNIPVNQNFIGRAFERKRLGNIGRDDAPAIIILYGRRRVGKTELLEQTFRDRNILKFEGRENVPELQQMKRVMEELAEYANQSLLKNVNVQSWREAFQYIHQQTTSGVWTIYFEEVQWLAQYKDDFISELKYAWDNLFRLNKEIVLILCGSSPSFMINQVMHSKALYNRSQHEMHLEPFTLAEAAQYLPKHTHRSVMDAYLTVGGIPVYLDRLKKKSSVLLSLCENAFTKDAYFANEYQKIFISSMSNNKHYQDVVRYLSQRKYATRMELSKHLKLQSGSNLTALLADLEICGFIDKYAPYNTANNSKLVRYAIKDAYLQFYYKFIEPKAKQIASGRYNDNPRSALSDNDYTQWLGYAFERFCRQNSHKIAKLLGFSAVNYTDGAFFNRETNKAAPGFQIDLLFDRADQVITICEIKYSINKLSVKVIKEFEQKLERFPNKANKSIQKVLIASAGVSDAVIDASYFDEIIILDDLFV